MTEKTPSDDQETVLSFLGTYVLAQHSAHAHQQLLDAAFHIFLTRLAYEPDLTEERFEELSVEAYSTFVEASLAAYRTWLREVGGEQRPEVWEPALITSREQFEEMVEDFHDSLERFGVL